MPFPEPGHWEAPTSTIGWSAFIAASKSLHAEMTETGHTIITTHPEEKMTFIGDGVVPVFNTAQPTANAAVGVVPSGPFVGGGGNGGAGEGLSLGMITVMVMVYNVCAGLGLGVMLWKGIIDWKGNIKPPVNAYNNDAESDDENNVDNENDNSTNLTYTDRNAGVDLGRPFNVVDSAETNPDIPPGVVEVEGANGRTTRARLSAIMDAAVHELRMRAAGLY